MKKIIILLGSFILTFFICSAAYALPKGEIDITYFEGPQHLHIIGYEYWSCGHVQYLWGSRSDYFNWFSPGECPTVTITNSDILQCAEDNPYNPIAGYSALRQCIRNLGDPW